MERSGVVPGHQHGPNSVFWRNRYFPSALDTLVPPEASDPRSRTLLVGWELGGGRGHIERLVPVVSAYLDRGWRVVAALRNAQLGVARFAGLRDRHGPSSLQIIQAPRLAEQRLENEPPASLAQVFCQMGFDDPALVAPLVKSWESILQHVRPSAVLSDYAPGLDLAARGRVPLLVIGNGWTLPPGIDLIPPLGVTPAGNDTVDYEVRVLACCEMVIASARAPQRFSDLLRGDVNALCVIPELDPYRDVRSDAYHWSPEMPAPSPVPTAQRRGGLVYLPVNHPDRASVAKACTESNIAFTAYFGGEGAGRYGNMTVSAEPIDFIREVPRTKIIVHHGGLGTAMWALVNGVSQWGCATDLEKSVYLRLSRVRPGSTLAHLNRLQEIDQMGRAK